MIRLLPFLLIALSATTYAECLQLKVDRIFDGKRVLEAKFIKISSDTIISIDNLRDKSCSLKHYQGATALPGLIDTHSLIFATDDTYGVDFANALIRNQAMTEEDRFRLARTRLCQYIEAGFTTVRDLGNSNRYYDVELRDLIKRYQIPYPRMIVSGPGITAAGGQFPSGHAHNDEYDDYLGMSSLKKQLSKRIALKVDWVKLYSDNDPNKNELSLSELKEVVSETKKHNLPVAIHATSSASIDRAIEAGATSIQHGYGATTKQLQRLKDNSIFLIPTNRGERIVKAITPKLVGKLAFHFREINKREISLQKIRLQNAIETGVPMAFGSDYYLLTDKVGIPFIDGVYSSLYSFVEAGLSPLGTIKMATSNASKLLKDDRLGILASGSIADILIVKGNPIQNILDIERVVQVYKEGRAINHKGIERCQKSF